MAVQFITGSAGSGKSTYVMQTVATQLKENNQKKIILIVPEQATFCYQYDLITKYGLSGVLTLEVLSFQRLARTVMQHTGGLARQTIDDLGKLLVLRRMIQNESSQYPYFNQSINRSGYLQKLADTIQELKRYQISSNTLQQIATETGNQKSVFHNKVQELSNLYSSYESFLSQEYLDSEDILDTLLKQLDETDLLSNTEIWVDEFYDFTPQEFAILKKLMQCAKQVHIVLPLDSANNNPGRNALFHNIEKSLVYLRSVAVEQHTEVLPDVVLPASMRWEQNKEVAFLEAQYFAVGTSTYGEFPRNIRLTQAQNRMSEVDYVARTIRTLCREQGYRYSDIGIFTRGEQYELLLDTMLTDYDIPYFIDRKETVQQHPLTELVLSVFQVIESNWSYQSVFRFLKCGLLPFSQSAIDQLENYVLRYGIKGSTWYRKEDWKFGLEQINEETKAEVICQLNQLRKEIVMPLYHFEQTVSKEQTASQIITALYTLLETYQVPAQLKLICEDAYDKQLLETAQLHQQIWDKLIHIFNQIAALLQDSPLSADAFGTILETAVQNLDLGLIPSSLDQVFVGAIAHSRARNLKVVFVLGLNEGVFPAKISQEGFFNDLEKEELRKLGVGLSPDSKDQIYDEQFLIYLAITRASDQLYFSYSLSDDEGKALRPSAIVNKVKRLYPALNEEIAQWPPDDQQDVLPYLNHKQKALGLLGASLAHGKTKDETIWTDLYHWYCENQDETFAIFQQTMLQDELLQPKVLSNGAFFGTPLRLSVSALEQYRRCPYSYFLTYGLRLQERKLYQIEAVDTGQFYHAAIEQFSNYLLEENLSWQSLDAEQVKSIMSKIVDDLAPQMQNDILMSTGRYQYIRRQLGKTLERSALLLMEHGKRGDFVPVAIEAEFGSANSKIPGLDITLQDGTKLYLRGKIDRIEQAKQGQTNYLRVIDFKSGKQGLDLTDIYYGLKIQLLTYLNVALEYYDTLLHEEETLLPAGVLYYFFKSGILQSEGPLNQDQATALHQKYVRADGLLLADMHALKLAQHDLNTGASTLLPVNLLKSAEPYIADPDSFDTIEDPMELFGKRNRTVVSKEQLSILLEHTKQVITSLGEAIHSGNIAIRPCRLRQFTGCQYCNYQAICQIETVDFLKNSEELIPFKQEEIWNQLKGGEGHA